MRSCVQRHVHWPAIAIVIALVIAALAPAGATSNYQDLAGRIDRQNLSARIEQFASLGSRVSGYPGNEKAADLIAQTFKQLGLEVWEQEFELPTPLEESAALKIGGRNYRLHSVWPNLCRTSQVPAGGVSGPIIYVGPGRLSDFNGKPVQNAIVLMDFETGQNWLNAPLLGAAAVVFIEPAHITRGEAEMKMIRCPVNVPRFYVSADDAAEIRAMAV
ncbi:MAG: hypothetical protein J7M38_06465, partial [Armatimonadetes bacterium]|nr:hypothetical protein [Armatimonadota bacterium]